MSTSCFDSAILLGYIGPGGGVALLGPLAAVVAAVIGAVAMVALWPLRLLIRRLRAGRSATSPERAASSSK